VGILVHRSLVLEQARWISTCVPNIQATDCPGTAFLTSKCVEAIETVLQVFLRRRDRFKELIELLDQLRQVNTLHAGLNSKEFEPAHDYKARTLVPDIRQHIVDLGLDSSFPSTYQDWNATLQAQAPASKPPGDDFCEKVVRSFRRSLSRSKPDGAQRIRSKGSIAELTGMKRYVDAIHDLLQFRLRLDDGKQSWNGGALRKPPPI
jgi:hypothetical protein